MIIGIGIDIVEIKRVQTIISRTGDRFAHRILSDDEWMQYQQHNQRIRFLAKRFAVKEAVSKAFGTGIRYGLTFADFAVYNDSLGKPSLRLFSQAKKLASRLGVTSIHVTLADELRYAYALVILER